MCACRARCGCRRPDHTSNCAPSAITGNDEKISFDEKAFRFALNEDPMATEKLAEGIRKFSADIVKLEQIIAAKL